MKRDVTMKPILSMVRYCRLCGEDIDDDKRLPDKEAGYRVYIVDDDGMGKSTFVHYKCLLKYEQRN